MGDPSGLPWKIKHGIELRMVETDQTKHLLAGVEGGNRVATIETDQTKHLLAGVEGGNRAITIETDRLNLATSGNRTDEITAY